jgi:plasmid stability protein
MSVMIQIRNVPDPLHRLLKSRAALAGVSLSEYLLREIARAAQVPTLEELRQRVASREPVSPPVAAADIIRAERDRE